MAQDLVLLASLHIGKVSVWKRPRVSIIPTGSELTDRITDASSGKIAESHSLLLERLVEEAGGRTETFPIVPDEEKALSSALRKAARDTDIVFTLAGSSVGAPDLVDPVIRGFGKSTSLLIHGLKVNRGRVMGLAVVYDTPVVIMPGPIQGALNAFIVLGYPLIRHHLGMGWEEPPWVPATMEEEWLASGKFRDFDQVVYLTLSKDPHRPGRLAASASGAETEKVSFLVSKNSYTIVTGSDPRLSKGSVVKAHILPGFSRLE